MGSRMALLVGSAWLGLTAVVHAQPVEGEAETPPADAPPSEQATEPEQPPPVVKDPKVAKKWLAAAQQLMQKGDAATKKGNATDAKTHYDNAITAYQKAIEASDDPALGYSLALAEDKAGNTPDAMKHLKAVLAAQGIKPDIMKKAQAKLDEMSMKVGIVILAITPEGTQVSVGGKPFGEAPLTDPLVLMPGTHTVSFEAVGFQPKDIELKIEAGSESERKIALDPVPVVVKAPEPEPEPPPPPPPPKPSMLPVYIGGGAAATLAVVATVTGIMAVSKHGTYTDPAASGTDRKDAQSSGKSLATVTDICLVGAIGAAAFTSYWYLYKYRPAARVYAERQAKVDVVPWVQPQAGGLVVAGSF